MKILLYIFILSTLAAGCGDVAATPAPKVKVPSCNWEKKLCPDGSQVGRSGPKCEFDPCPPEE